MKKNVILCCLSFLMLPSFVGAAPFYEEQEVTDVVNATDYLSVEPVDVKCGDTLTLAVQMTNETPLTAFQCDVYLPEGVGMVQDEEASYLVELEPARVTSSHTITAQEQADGAIRLASYSTKSKNFKGTSGNLFYMTLVVSPEAAGEKLVALKNIIFSTASMESVVMSDVEGKVNVIPPTNEWFVADTTVYDCYSLSLPVSMFNETGLTAFQCDVYLPEGLSFVLNADEEPDVVLESSRCTSSHSVTVQKQPDGAVRLVCYSSKSVDFKGNDGTLFYLNLQADKENVGEKWEVSIKNIIASTADSRSVEIGDIQSQLAFCLNSYRLIFEIDGEEYKNYTVLFDSELSLEAVPDREGHTFSGWSGLPETMPAHDVTVTGSFVPNKYVATFVIDGETVAADSILYATSVTCPEAPEKEGHTFAGWSDVPETMPAQDIVVTGSYTVNTYTIIYKVDGEVYAEETYEYGAVIVPKEDLEREGHVFSGWSEHPETMPAHDVIVSGEFVPDAIGTIGIQEKVNIYDLNGVLLKEKVSRENLERVLPRGIYVIGKQKVYVK